MNAHYIYLIMNPDMNINILITGPVSAGKSTFTNLLFVEQFSDMKIKRTTAVPQVYHEVLDLKEVNVKEILERNRKINTDIMTKTENPVYKLKLEDVKEIEYYVPRLHDFMKLKKDVKLSIYDTPGLNDSRTKDVYYQYINNVFKKLNVIIFVLDIYSSMNTSDEVDILKMIITNIKNNKLKYNMTTKLVVLLNKADDMSLDPRTNKYCLDTELQEMFNQANGIISSTVKEIYRDLDYDILPISCEDAYVYRMYKRNQNVKLDEKHLNKFGANEYGKSKWNKMSYEEKQSKVPELFKSIDDESGYKDRMKMTGYDQFRIVMQKVFSVTSQYEYLLDHIKLDIQALTANFNKVDITNELELFQKHHKYLDELVKSFDKPLGEFQFLYAIFDEFIINYCIQFTEAFWSVLKTNKSIDTYQLIYKMYVTYKEYFITGRQYIEDKKSFEKFSKLINDKIEEVLKYINIYWIEKMDNPNLTFMQIVQYFDELYGSKYEILHELVCRKMSNVSFYTNIYANHYYTNELESMLDSLEKRYKMPTSMITDLAFTIVSNTYLMLANNDVLNKLCYHWHNVVLKSSNKYYKKLLCFKNTFTSNITTMNTFLKSDNVPCNYMSDYIIKRLENEYPNEIAKLDDLYFKQVDKVLLVKEETKQEDDIVFVHKD